MNGSGPCGCYCDYERERDKEDYYYYYYDCYVVTVVYALISLFPPLIVELDDKGLEYIE